jgi:hypothetical protein
VWLSLFVTLVGTGWQLVVLTLGVILFAVLGPLHGEVHEERMQAILICYSLSSIDCQWIPSCPASSSSQEYFPMSYNHVYARLSTESAE